MNKELQEKLQDYVYNSQDNVDPQEIWDGILDKQKKEDRNKPLLLIRGLALGLLVLIPAALYFHFNNQSDKAPIANAARNKVNYISNDSELEQIMTTNHGATSDQENSDASLAIQLPVANNRQTIKQDAFIETSLSSEERKSDYIFQNNSNIIKSEKTLSFEKAMQSSPIPKEDRRLATALSPTPQIYSLLPGMLEEKHIRPVMPTNLIIPTRKPKPALVLSFVGGLSDITSTITSPGSADFVVNQWESSVNPQLSFGNRLLAGLQFANGFEVSTGLAFNRVHENFIYDGQFITDANGNPISETAMDENGNLTADFSSTALTGDLFHSVTRNLNTYNVFQYLDIPVQVAYKHNIGKFYAGIYAAFSFNLFATNRGYIINEFGLPTNFEEITASPIISNKIYSGLSLGYQITNGLTISIGLEYGERDRQINDLVRKHQSIGSTIGIEWQL